EHLLAMMQDTAGERARAHAHELLADHYKRRMELHPTRDIFPAEVFFFADEVKLRPDAEKLVEELAKLNITRFPWSRFAVISYVRSKDAQSAYAKRLALERARNLSESFVRAGLDPRRIEARGVVVDSPLVYDPHDNKDRYSQAVELTPLDAK
ncbi:MAG: hypothetical protein KDD62_09730, partial [Bdellovibrionales bacterium]|nr:hypothetical protein [Bdellovibrionales bacterium]